MIEALLTIHHHQNHAADHNRKRHQKSAAIQSGAIPFREAPLAIKHNRSDFLIAFQWIEPDPYPVV
jgi:hypothetical protein